MKRNLLVLMSIFFCLSMVISVCARDGFAREKRTDRTIDRRTDRMMDRKTERRDSLRGGKVLGEDVTDNIIDRRTDRQGERKVERRDGIRGEEAMEALSTQAGEEVGTKGKAVSDLYDENSRERRNTYNENMPRRRSLFDENSTQRRELKTSIDQSGDGKISKEEIADNKEMIQALYGENSSERQGLYNENSNERRTQFSENSAQRENLLKTFDFDEDGKISKEEMEDANTILDSMAE